MNSEEIFLKNLQFKEYEEVLLKDLGSRKKLKCFYLETTNGNTLLFCSLGKSRILKKEIDSLEELCSTFSEKFDKKYTKKLFLHTCPICSKALKFGQSIGWEIVHVPL